MVINALKLKNPELINFQSNDPELLIMFLINTMHDELNIIKNNYHQFQFGNQYDYNITFNLFFKYFINNYKSIISDLFYGMQNLMMTCLNCKTTSHNIQCFNILIFPLEEVRIYKNKTTVDIIECFEYYNQKKQYMRFDNQMYCNNCLKMADSLSETKLLISPNVLLVYLNRGKDNYNTILTYNEYLDIKNFIYYKDSPNFYELIGIVNLFYNINNNMYFIAFCKSFIDYKWYKYDNEEVVLSSFDEAYSTGIPSILFYSYIKR